MRNLIDNTCKHLRALETLGQPTTTWDTLLVYIITKKLDVQTLREWEEEKKGQKFPTFDELKQFLRNKANVLETIQNTTEKPKFKVKQTLLTGTSIKCNNCKKNHLIYNCPEFLKLSMVDRKRRVESLKLCHNCLRTNHTTEQCRLRNCMKCKERHNSLLHEDASDEQPSTSVLSTYTKSKQVLLSTAVILVKGKSGKYSPCRSILDSGSQSNFVTTSMAKKLGLAVDKENIDIVGIGKTNTKIRSRCAMEIKSTNSNFSTSISVLIIDNISGDIPSEHINCAQSVFPNNISLADPEFGDPGKIDILLGAEIFWELILNGKISLGKNQPTLYNTKLGWVVAGSYFQENKTAYCGLTTKLHEEIQKFWEVENCEESSELTYDELDCERQFTETTTRNKDGRFVVKLPLKESVLKLGDSKIAAKKRFLNLEKGLEQKASKHLYQQFMDEYENLGHMTKLKQGQEEEPAYYFPHHGIVKDSTTTKLRVVFDGSALSDSGISLNDLQHRGPKIHGDILAILIRLRQYNYVVTSDVSKMYRQIILHPDHRPLHRIFWRKDSNEELDIFELNTVTYGTKSAPYLAIRCMKQLASQNKARFPEASEVIDRDFYVDDLLTGTNDESKLEQLCKDVSCIMEGAGFQMHKWRSNCPQLLQKLQTREGEDSVMLGHNDGIKTLGVRWTSSADTFSFNIAIATGERTITKRSILSDIAKIYDPLGLISPVTILAKIMIQQLWKLEMDWDAEVPSELVERWTEFKVQLTELRNLSIPRQAMFHDEKIELHGYCDASKSAYASCIYAVSYQNYNITSRLLCAKTKVAPVKEMTIPRLELCGAVLLVRLMEKVKSSLTTPVTIRYGCDSKIVLAWINSTPGNYQIFVANRVREIQASTQKKQWRYVASKQNPADVASRGRLPKELITDELWWKGPEIEEAEESGESQLYWHVNELPELKKQVTLAATTKREGFPFNKYSDLGKLTRIMAYCLRFINNCKRQGNKLNGSLRPKEITDSLKRLIKIAQGDSFEEEMKLFRKKECLPTKSKISSLSPFMDEEEMLRVGGRLAYADISVNKKHPLLLDSKHIISKLLLESEHKRLLHCGPQHLLASVREKYWPIGGRTLARGVVRRCVTCFRAQPHNINPVMGNLPQQRITPMPPFTCTGVDYAGPYSIRDRKGRGSKVSKCYICMFVCFTTKAIHIELVTELSADAFLAGFKRFVSRRGKPADVYSDNGTNFVKANSELKEFSQFLNNSGSEISAALARELINWHFIPPYSPHMGGLWEAGIKSIKHGLKRVVGELILTYEELSTILTQIEAMLNSRPLYPIANDPTDLLPLTPGHFLIGRPMMAVPEGDLTETKTGLLSRFKLVQQVQQHFWKRWSLEYMGELQRKAKWRHPYPNIEKDALVVIKDNNLPPSRWSLGRVTETHPGQDGIVRVVTLRTANGHTRRAVAKLCPLPIMN